MEGRLSSVLLGPIASFWCGDFSVGACFLQRYIRDFRIVSKESSAVRTRRDRKSSFWGKPFSYRTSELSEIILPFKTWLLLEIRPDITPADINPTRGSEQFCRA
jgi:hypothetical protein